MTPTTRGRAGANSGDYQLVNLLRQRGAWLYAPLPGFSFSDRSTQPSASATPAGLVGTLLEFSGRGPAAVAPADGNRPVLTASDGRFSLSPDGVDDHLVLNSTASFPGDFTAYATGTRTTGQNLCVFGGTGGGSGDYAGVFTDNNAYILTDGTTISSAAVSATGTFLARWRRSGTTIRFCWTGNAEIVLSGASSAPLTLSAILARTATLDPASAVGLFQCCLVPADAVSDGSDAAFQSLLRAKFGFGL